MHFCTTNVIFLYFCIYNSAYYISAVLYHCKCYSRIKITIADKQHMVMNKLYQPTFILVTHQSAMAVQIVSDELVVCECLFCKL